MKNYSVELPSTLVVVLIPRTETFSFTSFTRTRQKNTFNRIYRQVHFLLGQQCYTVCWSVEKPTTIISDVRILEKDRSYSEKLEPIEFVIVQGNS